MKRKAILIESSNVSGQSDLPGARVDVQNWQNFLKSSLGGAWDETEVVTLRKPLSSEVTAALNVENDCYCFVAFSGHGTDGAVVLNDYRDNFPISDLRPKSRRGTLIVDSCRGLNEARMTNFSRGIMAANESLGREVALNAKDGRSTDFKKSAYLESLIMTRNAHSTKWSGSILASTAGIVEMLSCAKGQGAGEDPKAGGFYTALLLQSADLWELNTFGAGVHTTRNAHDHAVSLLPPQQTPEYKPDNLAYPFAVKV